MFLEFDFAGGPFYEKYPNFYFWFSPLPGPQGTRGALGVRQIKKLQKTKSDRHPILAGAPFWGFCRARRASGVRHIKKLNKTKCS